MSRVVVIAGVDTGVGKTLFSLAFIEAARASGRSIVAIKPIESGCDDTEAEDGRRLARATGQTEPREALQRFRRPISPWLAAEAENDRPRPDLWLRMIEEMAPHHEITLVEGAGGLLSPLAPGFDLRRLALALQGEVWLVAADRLGAQAAILAQIEALESVGLATPILILSAVEPDHIDDLGNRVILERVRPDLRILEMPHIEAEDFGAFLTTLEPWT